MRRPRHLKILARDYLVEWQKPKNMGQCGGSAGRVVVDTQRIWIDRTNHPDRQKAVLIHEILHVIDFHHGIDLDEKQTEAIACGLFEFARRNKKTWKDLCR